MASGAARGVGVSGSGMILSWRADITDALHKNAGSEWKVSDLCQTRRSHKTVSSYPTEDGHVLGTISLDPENQNPPDDQSGEWDRNISAAGTYRQRGPLGRCTRDLTTSSVSQEAGPEAYQPKAVGVDPGETGVRKPYDRNRPVRARSAWKGAAGCQPTEKMEPKKGDISRS